MSGSGPVLFESQIRNAALQKALALINQPEATLVDLSRAATTLLDLLSRQPEQPDALQLLGIARRMQGQNREAEELYRRSLAAKPDQPHVHHNLGNLLQAEGRLDDAIAAQRAAIELKRDYLEAHHNLATALARNGDNDAAEKSFRAALRLNPSYMLSRQGLAAVLNDLGRPEEAETILRRALADAPRDPRQVAALEHNLAVALKLQKKYEEALKLFDSAQVKAPDMPKVDFNRASTLEHLGYVEQAANFYRRAVTRSPLDLASHAALNSVLYRLGRDEEFLRSYDESFRRNPEAGELPLAKASFQFQREDFAGARESYEIASRLLPGNVTPHDGLAMILARQGEFAPAIREHEIVLKMEPENAHGWRNFAETLVRTGDAQKARSALERSLAIEPEHQGTLALYGTVLDLLGDPRAAELNDYDKFVQMFEIAPPEGFSDIESFNRELDLYLNRMHVDRREDVDQTLRRGTQTHDNLFGQGHDLVERLRVQIDKAVNAYIQRMAPGETHPLLGRRRDGFEYSASWSARLHDQGFHTNHYHPKGWISSAYYVALPEAVADESARQGWIKFGEPHFDAGLKQPIRRAIQPRSGMLVLFPSYTWHGTVPFHSGAARTTIAFDAVPR
ncbi:MAG TPA: tetratricopeptide repeat protein [Rhizomicrobium sp.]|jgi:tetratricopeptide (TPR) repeat protein|nr:tetratricopeptide repeat protein [Rhizomicrobium sp.]